MRLLIVSYSYAPALSPRAFRWTALAEAWAAEGHTVTVIAGRPGGTPARETLRGVEVIRLSGRLQRAREGEGSTRQVAASPTLKAKIRRLVYRRVIWPLQWPDYAWDWIRPCVEQIQQELSRSSPEAVITVSHPFSSHWAGLSALAGRHPNWLADIGDPFAFLEATPVNAIHFRRRNERAERRVLEACRRSSVTTEETRQAYAAHYPGLVKHMHVIGPLLSLPETAFESGAAPLERGRRRLVYLGTLYRAIRNPEPALRLLEALRQGPDGSSWELHVVGSVNDCADLLQGRDGVVVHGKVPRGEAIEHMRNATALINLGNSTSYQAPSKLVEYGASGRPIINLVAQPVDTSVTFLTGHPSVLTLVESDSTSWVDRASRVRQFLEGHEGVSLTGIRRWLEPHLLPSIKSAYEELIGCES